MENSDGDAIRTERDDLIATVRGYRDAWHEVHAALQAIASTLGRAADDLRSFP